MKIVVMDRSSVGDDTCVDGFYRFGEVEQHYSTPNATAVHNMKNYRSLRGALAYCDSGV